MLLIPFIDNLGNSYIPFFIVREIQKKKYVLYMKKNWLLLITYIIGILSRIFGYKKICIFEALVNFAYIRVTPVLYM